MSLLKELLGITEAASTEPVDITALADRSPKYLEQYVHALSAQNENRLTYKGKSIFGEIYNKLEEAGQSLLKKEKVDVYVPLDNVGIDDIAVDGGDVDWHEFTYEASLADAQEVYLGYSPSTNALYIGFDCWLDEEDFNDNWDKEFEENVGVDYDDSLPNHEKFLSKVWKKYLNGHNNAGYLLKWDGKSLTTEMSSDDGFNEKKSKLFYSAIYTSSQFRALKLVDLRLD